MADKRNYTSRAKYMIQAVAERRRKIRDLAVQYKGGKCQVCGYNKCPQALEFHHLSPSGKDFGISDKGYTRSWQKYKTRLINVFSYVLIVIGKSILVLRSFQKKFWNVLLGITVKPLWGNTVGTFIWKGRRRD